MTAFSLMSRSSRTTAMIAKKTNDSAAVLLNVDDHEGARYARSRILSSAGFRVHDASNGEETLALAEKHRPDLILLDVHLPDLNGIEVCRRLKQAQHCSLMVLQISASALLRSACEGGSRRGGRRLPDGAGRSGCPGGDRQGITSPASG